MTILLLGCKNIFVTSVN